jgi:uncharacterized membrane protein YidH (DUF202 family)
MKAFTVIGAVLVLLGIGGLVYGGLTYTTREKVLDIGPIEATAEKDHHVPIPEIASILAVIAGVVFVAVSMKRS